jgi:hypothetical protein
MTEPPKRRRVRSLRGRDVLTARESRGMRWWAVVLALLVAAPAHANDDDDALLAARVVFARDGALWRTDGKGAGPAEELAALPGAATAADVRTLRTDAAGKVLIADIAGTWHWLPLDGSTTALTALACKGAASLADDASCVTCANDKDQVRIIQLATGKTFDVAVPAAGAVIAGTGKQRRLIWSDAGIWSAPPGKLAAKQSLAPEAPLRALSIAPDASRALGVYAGEIYTSRKETEPAEVLFTFALDGVGARRKTIRTGVPVMWSHDSQWVLVQDGANACIARGVGGQYKCWKGYTATSLAPDGSYALVLGPRKGGKDKDAPRKERGGERGGEGDDDDDDDDATATAPTGPLSLYRAELSGAYTDPPVVVETIVEGAAVWLP